MGIGNSAAQQQLQEGDNQEEQLDVLTNCGLKKILLSFSHERKKVYVIYFPPYRGHTLEGNNYVYILRVLYFKIGNNGKITINIKNNDKERLDLMKE